MLALLAFALIGCGKPAIPASTPPSVKLPPLTLETIKDTPDKDIEDVLFEYCDNVIGYGDGEHERFSALPAGLRMLYSTWLLEAEVYNGGFHQFFWNSSGWYAREAAKGLRLIGATTDAIRLDKAIDVFRQEEKRMNAHKGDDLKEGYLDSVKESKLPTLDQDFYDKADDLSKLRITYIRAHPEHFVVGE